MYPDEIMHSRVKKIIWDVKDYNYNIPAYLHDAAYVARLGRHKRRVSEKNQVRALVALIIVVALIGFLA